MWSLFFVAVVVLILQFTAVGFARIGPYTFDLALITLVFFSMKYGLVTGLALGLSFGIFNALIGVNPFWLNILLYAMIGSLTGYVGQWLYKEKLSTFLLMVSWPLFLVYFLNVPSRHLRFFLPLAVYNLAISAFLFYFFRGLGYESR